mgnify:CR=1 FL=1
MPSKVAIAVVESNGHFLVGIRPDGRPLAGMSEFPGGRCESDETPRSCVVRECREETGLVVLPQKHLATVGHSYEHGTLELHFWKCCLAPDYDAMAEPAAPFAWVSRDQLSEHDFPPANDEVLQLITSSD